MSTISETTNTSVTQPIETTSNSAHGELPNIQATYRLNGKNYLKWSQLVRTHLKGRGKLSHLLGTGPKEGDPKFDAWDEEDSMVMSWLWNSMSPEISDTCMFLNTAKEIWEAIKQTYSKVRDAAKIYEIKMKIAATKQGNRTYGYKSLAKKSCNLLMRPFQSSLLKREEEELWSRILLGSVNCSSHYKQTSHKSA
ncbi:hypothetical protein ACOSQ3_009718 [Xanthoceras sorbifolium]